MESEGDVQRTPDFIHSVGCSSNARQVATARVVHGSTDDSAAETAVARPRAHFGGGGGGGGGGVFVFGSGINEDRPFDRQTGFLGECHVFNSLCRGWADEFPINGAEEERTVTLQWKQPQTCL